MARNWGFFAFWATLKGISLPDWKYFENTPTRKIKGRFDEFSKIRKIKESFPDWMDELAAKALGDDVWTKEAAELNEQADVILRVNTLKTTREKLKSDLFDLDIETEELAKYPNALKLAERGNVFTTEAFQNGHFEVQDASSQLVAEYLQVEPGMRVVDTCAGAGGKTLHLASLMENKGQIIALDIYDNKLKELKRRAKRAGAHNIEPRHIDSTKVIKKLYDKADRVLIDAPCSGLGVLRRNPDSKWKMQPEFLDKIVKTQQEILRNYSKIVKPGGKMVAATTENALTGKYPLSRFLYVYVNKAPNKPLGPLEMEFIKLVLSKAGQKIVVKDGYIPLPAKVVNKYLSKLK